MGTIERGVGVKPLHCRDARRIEFVGGNQWGL